MLVWIAAMHIRRSRNGVPKLDDATLDTMYLCAALFCDAVLEGFAIATLLR